MKVFKKINQTLGFTQNEGIIVIFLVAAFIIGVCIKFYLTAGQPMQKFDYSSSDSVFEARSRLLNLPESTRATAAKVLAADSAAFPDPFDSTEGESGRVHLNSATKEQLLSLPGVGESTAGLILTYRAQHGRFKSLDDLTNVHGIGPKKLERLRPYVTLED